MGGWLHRSAEQRLPATLVQGQGVQGSTAPGTFHCMPKGFLDFGGPAASSELDGTRGIALPPPVVDAIRGSSAAQLK